jgi:hypothetical protein
MLNRPVSLVFVYFDTFADQNMLLGLHLEPTANTFNLLGVVTRTLPAVRRRAFQ